MEELRKLTEYWRSETVEGLGLVSHCLLIHFSCFLCSNASLQVGLMLSSRKNLCLHPEIKSERDGKVAESLSPLLDSPANNGLYVPFPHSSSHSLTRGVYCILSLLKNRAVIRRPE